MVCHGDQSGRMRSSSPTCGGASRQGNGSPARRCRPSPRSLTTTGCRRPPSPGRCASSRTRAWCGWCHDGGRSGHRPSPVNLGQQVPVPSLTPETSASPAGLTVRARPEARPETDAASLSRNKLSAYYISLAPVRFPVDQTRSKRLGAAVVSR